jgi:integrase/recombinase XerC
MEIIDYKRKLQIRGYSDNTINAYCAVLHTYTSNYDINESGAKEYLKSLKMSGKSKNIHISAIRSYFKYCGIKHTIKNVKTFNKAVIPITEHEMKQILNRKNFFKEEHYIIFCLLYETGLRIGEFVSLKIKEINGNNLIVTGKGNKQRMVYLNDNQINQINKIAKNGMVCPYTYDYAKKMITDYLKDFKRVGITNSNKLSPHGLRHSFATHLNNNGAPIIAIKNMMGQSSVATTSNYTYISMEQLKKEHDKLKK